jgi:hypothetical protein
MSRQEYQPQIYSVPTRGRLLLLKCTLCCTEEALCCLCAAQAHMCMMHSAHMGPDCCPYDPDSKRVQCAPTCCVAVRGKTSSDMSVYTTIAAVMAIVLTAVITMAWCTELKLHTTAGAAHIMSRAYCDTGSTSTGGRGRCQP